MWKITLTWIPTFLTEEAQRIVLIVKTKQKAAALKRQRYGLHTETACVLLKLAFKPV